MYSVVRYVLTVQLYMELGEGDTTKTAEPIVLVIFNIKSTC